MTHMDKIWTEDRTNPERIQEILNSEVSMPGQGSTYATMMLMLGEAWLGDRGNTYLYVGEYDAWTHRVRQSFRKILEFEGFTVADNSERSDDRLFVGDEKHLVQTFIFWPIAKDFEWYASNWMFDKIFLDVNPETETQYYEEIQYLMTRQKI